MFQAAADTVIQIVASPDTVVNAVDSVKQVADSIARTIGSEAGTQVTAFTSLLLSIALKFVIDLGKKLSVTFDSASPSVKAFAVVAFGQLVTFFSAKTGIALQGDLSTLETTLSGLVVAVTAMGVHAVSKLLPKKTA